MTSSNSNVSATVDYDDVELGDRRRSERLRIISAALERRPNASLPAIAGSASELEAFYRFLSNPAIDYRDLLAAHTAATVERAKGEHLVRAIHDTTTCQFSHADQAEVGVLQTGKPGFYAHWSLLAGDSRQPLGTANLELISRDKRSPKGGRKKNRPGSETMKDPNRESLRWGRGVAAVRELGIPNVINLMDREADSYGLFDDMVANGDRFVVRIRHDRTAKKPEDPDWGKLKDHLKELPQCFEREVPLSPRRGSSAPIAAKRNPARKFRKARLSFAAGTVVIRCPQYLRATAAAQLTLNVVRVIEREPPPGEEPVEWLLVTTESIATPEDISRVVDLYRDRWLIEEFFKALKTGCAYETRQLETRHALLNTLALFAPVACRLLWLRSQARRFPDAPATAVLETDEIECLRCLSRRKLSTDITAQEALFALAEVGGHLKRNGEPGWQTLRRGFDQLMMFVAGWRAAKL